MKLELNNKTFDVKENKKSWTLKSDKGNFQLSYNISKSICTDFKSLEKYAKDHKLFETISE